MRPTKEVAITPVSVSLTSGKFWVMTTRHIHAAHEGSLLQKTKAELKAQSSVTFPLVPLLSGAKAY